MKFFRNRKTRGAISIFLIIITIPTMLFSAVLIDGSRMSSAKAISQEAADLAAASALANYNLDLKEDFGLFAMEDSSKVEEIYKKSLEATLMASGLSGSEEYSERIWEIMKSAVGGGNPYEDKKFLNLYDFSVDSCTVTPKYSLAEWQVLENQMVEYAKFRGIYVMADRLEILGQLGAMKAEASKNEETAGVMNDKMEVDEQNAGVEKKLDKLRNSIKILNAAVSNTKEYRDKYMASLKVKMKEIRLNNIETNETLSNEEKQLAKQYENNRAGFKNEAAGLSKKAADVLSKASDAEKAVKTAVEKLKRFQAENQGKAANNSNVADMIAEAGETIRHYEEVYLRDNINKILNDEVLKNLKNDGALGQRIEKITGNIDTAIYRYQKELEEQKKQEEEKKKQEEEEKKKEEEQTTEEEQKTEEQKKEEEQTTEESQEEKSITTYYYYFLEVNQQKDRKTENGDEALSASYQSGGYEPTIDRELSAFIGKQWPNINPIEEFPDTGESSEMNAGKAKEWSGSNEAPDNEGASAPRGEIPEDVYKARPSKTFETEGSPSSNNDFYNDNGDLSASQEIIGNAGSFIQQIGEATRDDILCLSYIFGTFKTRMTGVEKFSAKGMSESDKKSDYMPKWRYTHEDGEIDMRFLPKKDRQTVLRGEIEYLIWGMRTDAANENAVYATIFAERLANNMIALYSDKDGVRKSCRAAAKVAAKASAAVGIPIPAEVYFWIFLTAWATAETTVDMNFLIQGGYKIPLLKKKENIILKSLTDMDIKVEKYGDVKKGWFVSYEDYLLFMLLEGQNLRLMRSADLIEMSMKKKQSGFTMAKAYTYLNGKSEISTRYLFGDVVPFKSSYEEGGAVGRMRFTNEIYLGY